MLLECRGIKIFLAAEEEEASGPGVTALFPPPTLLLEYARPYIFLVFGCFLNKSRAYIFRGNNNQVKFMAGDLFSIRNSTGGAVMKACVIVKANPGS